MSFSVISRSSRMKNHIIVQHYSKEDLILRFSVLHLLLTKRMSVASSESERILQRSLPIESACLFRGLI